MVAGQAGAHHEISEFTREDIDALVAQGPDLRGKPKAPRQSPIQAIAPLSAGAPPPAPAAAEPAAAAVDAAPASTWGDTPG